MFFLLVVAVSLGCVGPALEDIHNPEVFYEKLQDLIDDAYDRVSDLMPAGMEWKLRKPYLAGVLNGDCGICNMDFEECISDVFGEEHCAPSLDHDTMIVVPSWPDIQRHQGSLDFIEAWARTGGVSNEEAYYVYIGIFVPLHEFGHYCEASYPKFEFPLPERFYHWFSEVHANSFPAVYWSDKKNADPTCEANYNLMRKIFSTHVSTAKNPPTPHGEYPEFFFGDNYAKFGSELTYSDYGNYQTFLIEKVFNLLDEIVLEVDVPETSYMAAYLANGQIFPGWTVDSFLFFDPLEDCAGSDSSCLSSCTDTTFFEISSSLQFDKDNEFDRIFMDDNGCGNSCNDCVKEYYREKNTRCEDDDAGIIEWLSSYGIDVSGCGGVSGWCTLDGNLAVQSQIQRLCPVTCNVDQCKKIPVEWTVTRSYSGWRKQKPRVDVFQGFENDVFHLECVYSPWCKKKGFGNTAYRLVDQTGKVIPRSGHYCCSQREMDGWTIEAESKVLPNQDRAFSMLDEIFQGPPMVGTLAIIGLFSLLFSIFRAFFSKKNYEEIQDEVI